MVQYKNINYVIIAIRHEIWHITGMRDHRAKAAALQVFWEGWKSPPDHKERRVITMYITYQDLIQTGIFIVALIGLCYTIFKGNK